MILRAALGAAVVGTAVSFATLPVAASTHEPRLLVETFTATTYLNGGIGKGEQAVMRRVAKEFSFEFSLRMTFSARKDGEFLADIPVVIADERGNPVFALSQAGPMLFVMLPDGKYKVSARFNGLTESQEVTLDGKDGKELYFHWKGKPEA